MHRMIMTYDQLKKIHINNKKLKRLSDKYKECKEDYGISSKRMDGMPKAGKVFDTSMNTRNEAYDIELEYRRLYYENELLISRARAYIDAFPDPQLQMILTLRFINGMPLYEVAAAIGGISERMCENIIRVHFMNVF